MHKQDSLCYTTRQNKIEERCRQTCVNDPLYNLNLESATAMVAELSSNERISIGFRLDLAVTSTCQDQTTQHQGSEKAENHSQDQSRTQYMETNAQLQPQCPVEMWRKSLIYSHWQVGLHTWELMAALTSISSSCAWSSSAAFGTWSYLIPPNQPSTTVILY